MTALPSPKRVLVTGSDGFVGNHLMKRLFADSNYVAYGIDKKPDTWQRVFSLSMDLADPSTVERVVELKPDIIVHLASTCSTLGSVLRPDETFRDAVITNGHMLEAARRLNVPYLLTTSVKARDGQTPYGAAKRMNELWAIEYAKTYGFPVIINRPGTIYGPGQEGSLESGWIAWFMKAKREGLQVTINGDGSQRRDLLHVSDYINLLMEQIEDPLMFAYRDSPGYIGEKFYYANDIWDIGGGGANTVSVEEIAEYLGLDHVHGHPRQGDVQEYIGSTQAHKWHVEQHWRYADVFQEFVPREDPMKSASTITISGSQTFDITDFKINLDPNAPLGFHVRPPDAAQP